jgi:hypothetical protein
VDRERAGRPDASDEGDGLADLHPGAGRRDQQGVDLVGGYEQGVSRVVEAVHDEPEVRAAGQSVDDLGVHAAHGLHGEAGGGEGLTRGDRDRSLAEFGGQRDHQHPIAVLDAHTGVPEMRQSHLITPSAGLGVGTGTIIAWRLRIVSCLPRGGEIRQATMCTPPVAVSPSRAGPRAIISAA